MKIELSSLTVHHFVDFFLTLNALIKDQKN